ncbi:ABC transporter substrate-binding protein [Nocardioides sp. NPDC126508]
MRLRLGSALAALALTTTLAACGGANSTSGDEEGGQKGGTLTILTSSTSITLDPANSWNLPVTTLGLLDRRLTNWKVGKSGEAEVVPDLATDTGTPSEDGKTWTYTLKDGIEFSDGTPITAKDVKYAIERTYAPALSEGIGYHRSLLAGSEGYQGPFDGKELDSIETPDDKTIVFHLNAPYGDWPWIVSTTSTAPVPAGKAPADTFGQKPVTSGPYAVESYTAGGDLVLVRNEHWDPKTDETRTAGPDKIVVRQGQDPAVEAQKLIADAPADQKTFGADFVPPAQLAQIQAKPDAKKRLVTSGPGALEYLALNTQSPKLKDVKVRQALNYAIDRKAYIVAAGGPVSADPASTLITPGIAGREDYELYDAGESGDVAKAKSLLASAGVKDLALTLITSNDATDVAKSEAIQQAYAKVGVKVTIKPLEDDAKTTADTGDDAKAYDLSLGSWQPDYPSAAGNIQPLFDSSQIGGGGYNISRYTSAAADGLIKKALAETDKEAAGKLWAQADRTILGDAPVVPLIYTKNSFLHGSKVADFYIGSFPAYPVYPAVTLEP